MTRSIARYGWRRDLPDQRDFRFAPDPGVMAALPTKIDRRSQCPPVYDQGDLGSCTGNAIAAALQFDRINQKIPQAWSLVPSRLFIYYNERVIEGDPSQDAGAEIRDGLKTVASQGACFESGPNAWPYDQNAFATKPPPECYAAALRDEALVYSSLAQSVEPMQACLAGGHPFIFGITVYDSFESDAASTTGVIPLPGPNEQVLGGHALLAVGYDQVSQRFVFRNSWSASWGDAGYGTIPFAYLTNSGLASDFWTIRTVEK